MPRAVARAVDDDEARIIAPLAADLRSGDLAGLRVERKTLRQRGEVVAFVDDEPIRRRSPGRLERAARIGRALPARMADPRDEVERRARGDDGWRGQRNCGDGAEQN